MKKIFLFLFVILTAMNFAQSGREECIRAKVEHFNRLQKFANINYPGDSNYDVKYYKLDISVNHTAHTIAGNITCNAVIVEPSVTEIYYDLTNPLVVDSVLLNGTVTTFTRGSDKLNINLNGTFNQGFAFTTVVYYHGTPGSSGFGSFTFGSTPAGQPSIYTLSEPYGAKDWWPVKDTPADKADSADFWITVSTSLIPASNGKLMAIVDNGNGTHTYKWKSSYPIAQYLLSMAITSFSQYTNYYHYSPTDSMPIDHFIYPEHLSAAIPHLNNTPGMIEIYSQLFGQYPFINEKYGHGEFGWGGGMEHQTITSLGGFGDFLIAHELAHMWWGDAITCKDWHHIWLNEGFATYGEGVIHEAWYGKPDYDNYIASEMNAAKIAQGSIWVQNINDINEIFNGYRSYAKGGVVLHMLRGIVGDSTFYDVLRAYTANPSLAYGVATTEDFQAVAESVSGMNLDYFFQEWIYGENYPKYHIAWTKNLIGGNNWNLFLSINQETNTSPAFYTIPIQIRVNRTTGDTLISVFNNAQNQQFNITINGEPTSIVIDPGNWILKTIVSFVPVELTSFSAILLNDKVALNWSTATETNNLGFEVQRKFDKSDWKMIGFVAGQGTTTERTNYYYEDDISEFKQAKLFYRLKQIDSNGTFIYSDEVEVIIHPDEYSLEQNYPNPFNPSTTIKFSMGKSGLTILKLYDVLGKEVVTLVNGELEAGPHEVTFNASNFPSGTYFYTMTSGSFTETRKMMFLK